VWRYLPKINGVFFQCRECKTWMPKTAKCLECKAKVNVKFSEALKQKHGKSMNLKSLDELKEKENKIIDYDLLSFDDEKTAREAYNYLVESVQSAYNVTNDFAEVAMALKEKGIKGLTRISLKPLKPIKVMLAQKVKDIDEAFKKVGKTAQIEYKYDGFRMQIHKQGGKIMIFTRSLENVTRQFPEVVGYVKKNVKGDSFIIDSEAVGYDPKTGKYLPFQNVSQRIKRKYEIDRMARDFPVEVNVFDIIYYNGKNMVKDDFRKRREVIERIITPVKKHIVFAKSIKTSDRKKAEAFYKEALKAGNEGVMFKNLEAPYKAGSRVGYMVKMKPVMESLDLVIVGGEWGEGKRATWITSFVVACIDEDGNFLEIGKVGTGIKELESEEGAVSFNQMTELLKPLMTSEKGKEIRVKPKIVIEVRYEEIQKSPKYSSGYALRFPRLVSLRTERRPDDISDLDMVEEFYEGQKK